MTPYQWAHVLAGWYCHMRGLMLSSTIDISALITFWDMKASEEGGSFQVKSRRILLCYNKTV